jgi:hypothetical protein
LATTFGRQPCNISTGFFDHSLESIGRHRKRCIKLPRRISRCALRDEATDLLPISYFVPLDLLQGLCFLIPPLGGRMRFLRASGV